MAPWTSAMEGLTLGLTTGAGCLAWCIPALGPYVATRAEGSRAGLRAVILFNAGRLGGYLVVLIAALVVGAAIEGAPWLRAVSAGALVPLGGLLLLHAIRVNFPDGKLCKLKGFAHILERFPLLAGLLIGISPCPPLLLAAAAVVSGGVAYGVVFGSAFFVGTSLFLLPMAALAHEPVRRVVSSAAEIAAVFAGLWFIAHGAALLKTMG